MLTLYRPVISGILSCAAFATLAGSGKLELLLLDGIQSDAPDGRLVVLQSAGSDGCWYLGTLESATHQDDGLADKLLTISVGNTDRFIRVTRKKCGERLEPTLFMIPLGRMKPGREAGARVTVMQPN
ncbi:MAG: hypothetical protein V4713_03865 [Pseudomonadota bacterium]